MLVRYLVCLLICQWCVFRWWAKRRPGRRHRRPGKSLIRSRNATARNVLCAPVFNVDKSMPWTLCCYKHSHYSVHLKHCELAQLWRCLANYFHVCWKISKVHIVTIYHQSLFCRRRITLRGGLGPKTHPIPVPVSRCTSFCKHNLYHWCSVVLLWYLFYINEFVSTTL